MMGSTQERGLSLWYRQPAERWFEALPLGNGRLGAMIYGGIRSERIDLTESTCWAGEASAENCPEGAAERIPEIRSALFSQDYARAEELAQGILGKKLNYGTNLPLGGLEIGFDYPAGGIADYERALCLDTAVATTTYRVGTVLYRCAAFVSHPAQVIVARVTTDAPEGVHLTARLGGGDNPYEVGTDACGDLLLRGQAFERIHSDGRTGVSFCGRLRVVAKGGDVSVSGDAVCVSGAQEALILVALGTTFGGGDPEALCRAQIDAAAARSYGELRAAHVADHLRLFGRVALDLGETSHPEWSTDERLAAVQEGAQDPALAALMFQYGRYLLLSSSRADSPLPTHLQGIWNDNVACRIGWTCDMHLDVNTQMNYWPAEVTNLGECTAPLFAWIERTLMPSGRQTAKQVYGCRGWVAHTVSNAWGYSAPGWSTHWGIHPTAGAWIASHLWEHYQFTGDRAFLAEHGYPVLVGAAQFYLDYLAQDPRSGHLVSGPASSPENAFSYQGGRYANDVGPTCDSVLIREILNACIAASETLDCDSEQRGVWAAARDRLPPFQIGRHGQLQEWLLDHEEALPNHRHTSHLLSVYPFHQINPDDTPELAEAARVSVERRMTPRERWEDTGWARSMLMLYAARLRDGEAAHQHILDMQRKLTEHNLFVVHPPTAGAQGNVYELDGNTGLCACIAEMLVQSHRGEIHLLPALPAAWSAGSVTGLCARGGFQVDMSWRDGKLTEAVIHSRLGRPCRVRCGERNVCLDVAAGGLCRLDGRLQVSGTL